MPGKFLNSDASVLFRPAARTTFRLAFPNLPGAGRANAVGSNQLVRPPGELGSCNRSGRYGAPPINALSPGSEMFKGVPVWKLLIPENCQLPRTLSLSEFPWKKGISYT